MRMRPVRDAERERVARAIRIVDLAILGASLVLAGGLLSLWESPERGKPIQEGEGRYREPGGDAHVECREQCPAPGVR